MRKASLRGSANGEAEAALELVLSVIQEGPEGQRQGRREGFFSSVGAHNPNCCPQSLWVDSCVKSLTRTHRTPPAEHARLCCPAARNPLHAPKCFSLEFMTPPLGSPWPHPWTTLPVPVLSTWSLLCVDGLSPPPAEPWVGGPGHCCVPAGHRAGAEYLLKQRLKSRARAQDLMGVQVPSVPSGAQGLTEREQRRWPQTRAHCRVRA